MKKHISYSSIAILFFVPMIVQAAPESFAALVAQIVGIIDTLTLILTGVAVIVFFAGLVQFILHSGDKTSVEAGRQKIFAGIIGLFVIVSVWGIVKIAANTFNLI